MTQYALGTIDPAMTDGTELADGMNGWAAAVHSNHRGGVRPAYAVAGMIWPKSVSATLTEINYFDGTADHLLLSVNPVTGQAVAANAFLRDAANLSAGKLPIDRLTAADLLTLIKTVDGAASGLDAQLLAGTSLAAILGRANHTGVQPLSSVAGADDAANLSTGKLPIDRLTAADLLTLIKTVDGAASGLDAQLLAGASLATILGRSNHTGVQTLATISDAGDAAGRNVGLVAGNVVEVQAGGALPALDGSALTGVVNTDISAKVTAPGYNATITVLHGLGAVPDNVFFRITCTAADVGFAVNDVLYFAGTFIELQNGFGFNISANATETKVRRSNYVWRIAYGTTYASLTNTKWDIEIISELY